MPHLQCVGSMFPACAVNMLPTKVQENFLQNVLVGLHVVLVMCRKHTSHKNAGNFPTVFIVNMCRKLAYT